MAERYGTIGNMATNTTTNKTMLRLLGGTGVIFRVYDLIVGCDGTPADGVFIYNAQRTTTAGTFTSVTPEPLDAQHALAAEVGGGANASAEPTYGGAAAIAIPANSRASYRWTAAPGGELISAASANAGWGFTSRSPALTLATRCTAHHVE